MKFAIVVIYGIVLFLAVIKQYCDSERCAKFLTIIGCIFIVFDFILGVIYFLQ